MQEIQNDSQITHSSYNTSLSVSGMKRKQAEKTKEEKWTTVSISLPVRLYIDQKSMEYRHKVGMITRESVDGTLRRLFGIKEEAEEKK